MTIDVRAVDGSLWARPQMRPFSCNCAPRSANPCGPRPFFHLKA